MPLPSPLKAAYWLLNSKLTVFCCLSVCFSSFNILKRLLLLWLKTYLRKILLLSYLFIYRWCVFFSLAPFKTFSSLQFSSVQLLSCVQLFLMPRTTAHQASLAITNSWSLPKLMSIESVMPSNHLILCQSLLLLPSIFPSIGAFSHESALHIRWPKYWSFSFYISPSNEHLRLVSFRMDSVDLLVVQDTLKSLLQQKHQFFGPQLSL